MRWPTSWLCHHRTFAVAAPPPEVGAVAVRPRREEQGGKRDEGPPRRKGGGRSRREAVPLPPLSLHRRTPSAPGPPRAGRGSAYGRHPARPGAAALPSVAAHCRCLLPSLLRDTLSSRIVGRDRLLWNSMVQGTQRFRQVRATSCVIPYVLCGCLYCLRC